MKTLIAASLAALIGTAAVVAVPVVSATAATVVVKVGPHHGWMWHSHRWHHRGWVCRRWHGHRHCHWRYW